MKFNATSTIDTPVLFLFFNRPIETKKVFRTLAKSKPKKLYLASDGAREINNELDIVTELREFIIQNINWECEVNTLFRDKNLGCKDAVSEAISWFFKTEKKGIILEDDCLPTESFFFFCEELLRKYEHDMRIWHISGVNFQDNKTKIDESYYFSRLPNVWGWATWSNRWASYNKELKNLNDESLNNILKDVVQNKSQLNYYKNILNKVSNNEIDTWDYSWNYSIWSNFGLSISPNKNLISNIGFGPQATHTKDTGLLSNLPTEEISFPLLHPKDIKPNKEADGVLLSKTVITPKDFILRKDLNFKHKLLMVYKKVKSLLKFQ